ncbi:hypothetical protein PIB30_029028 [Stylosanthes scabra]|uniref:Uncharacterized protein n=1 Tax=Stylosanthes scabra TaxID=79078 RepID=A0ABU6Y9E7_9FABA|nr:hypothetical protein [Stylosanthes scabra]
MPFPGSWLTRDACLRIQLPLFPLHRRIDPELSRAVYVSTEQDTRIRHFARPSDVEVFLSPPACALDGCILGDSPFFKSVPMILYTGPMMNSNRLSPYIN